MRSALSLAVVGLSLCGNGAASPVRGGGEVVRFKGPFNVEANSVHNIHVECSDSSWEGELSLVYGDCDMQEVHHRHHEVGRTTIKREAFPDRFVWVTPSDAVHGGCLHAYSGSTLLGRSNPIAVSRSLRKRQSISEVADTEGPWFDGVAFMESNNVSTTFVSEAKSKDIAIIGGGMSGAMTALLLQSVGVENWHIIESTQRIGGRIRTKYLNGSKPEDYQYQEMGPMRFPVSVRYADTNETVDIEDHKMVFQLAEYVNSLNGNDSALAVKFIPWIQSSPNVPANSRGYRLPDGRIPSASQLRANTSLAGPAPQYIDEDAADAAEEAMSEFINATADKWRAAGRNVYKAHKQAIEDGLFSWSEANYLRYELGLDANLTDFVAGASSMSPLWGDIYDNNYFAATTWRTIDKGLSSLPRAITPLVQNKTTFGRKVVGLTWNEETSKVGVKWREDPFAQLPEVEEYDYAVVAVPFSKVRLWRNPTYSSLLSRAINTMNYQQSCKVALHYKTRFWEHLSPPIIGGCGSTDIPGIGSVCYPAYNINGSGPGVILASYQSGTGARSVAALSEEDHVSLVQRAMVEVHGQIAAEQYTGNFDRQCWEVDEHHAGAWAAPFVGQQELYLPAYYQTEFNTIFIGEHTSYTHAWIFSALDSAVRGTTQLLLELGLVDEAKEIVDTWMGRWITV